MKNLLLPMLILACLCWQCSKSTNKHITKIIGKWASEENEGSRFIEEWNSDADGHFFGKGYVLQDGIDTSFSEVLQIEEKNGDFFYIATVKSENENKPVKFKLVRAEETFLVFENPLHDFPQRISYFFTDDRNLKVVVEGEQNEQQVSNEILLTKW